MIMSPDAPPELLATRLRTARLLAGMSMRELAARSEISVSHLSTIENGSGNASVSTLCKLCDALGMAVADLFASQPPELFPVRSDEREVLRADGQIVKTALLNEKGAQVSQYEVDIAPGGRTGGSNRHPGCAELIYVLTNSVTVRLDQSTAILNAGDSIHFPSEVEHEFINHTETDSRIHWTVIRKRGQS